jgi:hypothetical protein
MIGVKYTSELLAALTKTPLMARLDVAVPPVGDDPEEVDSYTVRYSDNGVKETTLFAAGDVRLVSIRVVGITNWSRLIDALVEKYIEETYAAADKITSLYGGMDDADPWPVIVEPV